jgi:hypothetical protein
MITWFAIQFADNSTGYQKMEDGYTIGVYRADGTVISPEEAVEYTCTNDNATAPTWYVAPTPEA